MAETPTRVHPWVNPELAIASLRRLVLAWDRHDDEDFRTELATARRLLEAKKPEPT